MAERALTPRCNIEPMTIANVLQFISLLFDFLIKEIEKLLLNWTMFEFSRCWLSLMPLFSPL